MIEKQRALHLGDGRKIWKAVLYSSRVPAVSLFWSDIGWGLTNIPDFLLDRCASTLSSPVMVGCIL